MKYKNSIFKNVNIRNLPNLPLKKVILEYNVCRFARECPQRRGYVQTCAFIIKFYISMNYFIFKNPAAKFVTRIVEI